MSRIRNCYAVGDGPLRSFASPVQYLFHPSNSQDYERSMLKGLQLVLNTLQNKDKPFSGILPHELAPEFRDVDLDQPLGSVDAVLAEVDALYLRDAVYFHQPKYVAHLNCPIVYPAILAELILSSINSSLDTWDQSAGGTLIEQKLIDWTVQRIGYDSRADGVFTSGGTQSNLMGLMLARDVHCRRRRHNNQMEGLPADAGLFRILTSEMSHFSVKKSAAILGLGYNAVIPVACDSAYRMDPDALEREIIKTRAAGLIPIAVVATAGTTDFGSIDPLPAIADICQRYDLWMHADAAYGCGLLCSSRYGHLLEGINRANSVTVDYHKSFFQPVSCGAFFCRDSEQLSLLTYHADYLNPLSAHREGTPNLVNKSLQTTRRFDALKLWMTLRTMGVQKVGSIFEQVMDRAREVHAILAADPAMDVLHHPELSTLVFRFVPENPIGDEALVNATNEYIRKSIMRTGHGMLAGTKIRGRSYLKMTLLNPLTRLDDINELLAMIRFHGHCYLEEQAYTPALTIEENHEQYYL